MKKSSLFLLLMVLVMLLSACSTSTNQAKTITLTELKSALGDDLDSDTVELNTVDDGKKVTQFTIKVSGVNAGKITNRSYVKDAIVLLMTKPGDMVYGQFKVTRGFSVVMDVLALLDTTPEGSFDMDTFVDEILDVMCDGKPHNEAGWTITTKVDEANDTLTITGTRQ